MEGVRRGDGERWDRGDRSGRDGEMSKWKCRLRWERTNEKGAGGVELGSGKREKVEKKVGTEDLEVEVEVGRGDGMWATWAIWL